MLNTTGLNLLRSNTWDALIPLFSDQVQVQVVTRVVEIKETVISPDTTMGTYVISGLVHNAK